MRGTLIAGYTAVAALTGNGVAFLLAAASENPASFGDLLTAGGSISAAGALIYIVRKMTDGQLVARDPARVEGQLVDLLEESNRLLAASQKREEVYQQLYQQLIATIITERQKP